MFNPDHHDDGSPLIPEDPYYFFAPFAVPMYLAFGGAVREAGTTDK